MASDVVHDKKEHLTERLLNTPREDLARFAEALRAAEPKTYRSLFSEDPQGFGLILIDNDIGTPSTTGITYLWLNGNMMVRKREGADRFDAWHISCIHHKHQGPREHTSWHVGRQQPGYYIMRAVSDGTDIEHYLQGWLKVAKPEQISRWRRVWAGALNVHRKVIKVGTDIVLWSFSKTGKVNITELKDKFKEAIARFLASAVEGAEVVAIENVSSTSVLLNSCVDVDGAEKALMPYACLGLGYNFTRVSDGALVPRLAYKVKVGIGVQIAHNVNAFAGLYHHQVLGNVKNIDLPVLQLLDDDSPDGRTKDAATASFNVAYSGCEVGLSFAF